MPSLDQEFYQFNGCPRAAFVEEGALQKVEAPPVISNNILGADLEAHWSSPDDFSGISSFRFDDNIASQVSQDTFNSDASECSCSMSNSADESSSKSVKDERNELVWIDHSVEDFSKDDDSRSNTGDSSSGEVDQIRRRIEKRKKRQYYQSRSLNTLSQHDKRARNTLAARKYRERRQKELDVLDQRVKALENELESARLEAKWWKMEASRWQECAKNSQDSLINQS